MASPLSRVVAWFSEPCSLAAVSLAARMKLGAWPCKILSSGKLKRLDRASEATMLVGFIPGDREEMVQCMSRRRQGSPVRGGDGEVVRTGIEPRESTVMAGVTTVKVMR